MVPKLIRRWIRLALRRLGIIAYTLESTPFGVDCLLDIERLTGPNPVKIILDVGANTGETACQFSETFPESQVVAFKPVPETCTELVAQTLRLNAVTAVRLALGAKSGAYPMFCGSNSLTNRSVLDAAKSGAPRAFEVDVTTLDDYCANHSINAIDFFKIDTEGMIWKFCAVDFACSQNGRFVSSLLSFSKSLRRTVKAFRGFSKQKHFFGNLIIGWRLWPRSKINYRN